MHAKREDLDPNGHRRSLERSPDERVFRGAAPESWVIVVPRRRPSYSETCIQNHIERLHSNSLAYFLPWYLDSLLLTPAGMKLWLTSPPAVQQAVRLCLGPHVRWLHGMVRMSFKRFLEGIRPAMVLAEFGPVGVAALEVCRRTRIPLAVHFHGFDAYRKDVLDVYLPHYLNLFRYAAAIVGVSRDMCDRLVRFGAPPGKVHLNPCGVSLGRFSGADPCVSPPLFVAVGRFVPKKAPDLTIRAFRAVHESHPDAKLLMIGEGELWGPCKTMVEHMGLSQAVELAGVLTQEGVAQRLRHARAFVQHSVTTTLGDAEGTPVAVLEAQATGLPVVATRHNGISDVVLHGRTGFLVDEGDVEGMAHHMRALAGSPELAARMGRCAREHVREHHGIEASLERLRGILTRSIARQTLRP